ncbi:FUSC family protein [Mesorhizobium yinganensis]|uniref:FUSC family protein n=1 Tax=Mesorhizobium yinganensis TaxID=3157707 RepID=UPI0032B7763E
MAALKPVVSVAFAVFTAHQLGLQDTWWAAISAIMVMQDSFGASLYRGLLRMLGTICGAVAALLLGPLIAPYPLAFAVIMCLTTWGCLYAALVYRHSYAWVLMLITFVMVMCEAVDPQGHLGLFALERVANVAVGTAGCLLVVALVEIRLIAAMLRGGQGWHELLGPMSGRLTEAPVDRKGAALHGLQGAIAMIVLSAAVSYWGLGPFAQGMVTATAVLVVPLDTAAGDPHLLVVQRMAQRFIGCLLAGFVALALLPLIEARPLWCQIALGLGVWAATFLQTLYPKGRYIGVQFLVAFLMVFVQDQGWTVAEEPALARLAGVMAGIVTLYAVFLLFRNTARQTAN